MMEMAKKPHAFNPTSISQSQRDASDDRYRDLRRPRKVTFYCNGDRYFKGKRVYITPHRYLTFNDLLTDLTGKLPHSMQLPYGVRQIFSPVGGRRIRDIEELQDGQTYVCGGFEVFKAIKYGKNEIEPWSTGKPRKHEFFPEPMGSSGEPHNINALHGPYTGPGRGFYGGFQPGRMLRQTYPYGPRRKFAGTFGSHGGQWSSTASSDNSPHIKPKVITVIRNGTKPRTNVKILLNRKSVQSFEQLMKDIAEAFGPKWKNNKVRKLFTIKGREVQGVSDFFREEEVFIGIGNEPLTTGDVQDILEEVYPESQYPKALMKEWDKTKKRYAHSNKHNKENEEAKDESKIDSGLGSDASKDGEEQKDEVIYKPKPADEPRRRKKKLREKDRDTSVPTDNLNDDEDLSIRLEKDRLRAAEEEREKARKRMQKRLDTERRVTEEERRKRGLVPLKPGVNDPFKRIQEEREKEHEIEQAKERERQQEQELERQRQADALAKKEAAELEEAKEKERERQREREMEIAEKAKKDKEVRKTRSKERPSQVSNESEPHQIIDEVKDQVEKQKKKSPRHKVQRKKDETDSKKSTTADAKEEKDNKKENNTASQDAEEEKNERKEGEATEKSVKKISTEKDPDQKSEGGKDEIDKNANKSKTTDTTPYKKHEMDENANKSKPVDARTGDEGKLESKNDKNEKDKNLEDNQKDQGKEKEKTKKKRSKTIVHKTKMERQISNVEHVLDKYEPGKVLGDGNFAIVKQCKVRNANQEYAMKIIDKAKLKGKEHMIENEIALMKICSQPNIVKLIEEFETKTEIYLIMELVKGGDLFDAITQSVKFGESEAAGMVCDLTNALFYLHSRGVVHRDLKPENLLVQRNKDRSITLKLADFGLAMEVKEPIFTVCGTPTYVAPEILSEIGYGLEVDMWAVGVITYILLCGFPPFRSPDRNQTELFEFIKAGEYEFLSPYWDKISRASKDLIARLLIVDKKKRYNAIDVLCHPWVITLGGSTRPAESMDETRKNLRRELEMQARQNRESFIKQKLGQA